MLVDIPRGKGISFLLLLGALALNIHASTVSELERGFVHPPDSARPWIFWFWLNGNITSNGITADLEAMQRVGIGGVVIMDVDQGTPKGPVTFLSPQWLDLFRHTCAEAKRLGLTVSMNDDAGWSGSGGPWITPELSMQKVVWSETTLDGPRHFDGIIAQPQSYVITTNRAPAGPISFGSGGAAARDDDKASNASNTNVFYGDISVFAFPTPSGDTTKMSDASPKITASVMGTNFDSAKLIDGNPKTAVTLPRPEGGKPQFIQIEFPQPYKARTLMLAMRGLQAHESSHGALQISDDGTNFKTVHEIEPEAAPIWVNLGTVESRYYRILFTSADPVIQRLDVAELDLSGKYRIDDIEEKALFVCNKDYPERTNKPVLPEGFAIPRDRLVDLSSHLRADGHLDWDVPAGNWTILRFGHTSTGKNNHPARDGGFGLECDKLSKEAADVIFDGFIARLVKEVGPSSGKAFTGTHIDSWEVGSQNWTPKFREEFRRRRGYDPVPYLPVMTGRVLDNLDVSERFLWDLRQTVSELLAENYAGELRKQANRHGLKITIEGYDGNPSQDLTYGAQADIPTAEYWTSPPYALSYACVEMASAAHVYGKPIVACESFTATETEKWLGHPFAIKPFGDWVFCHGINRMILHRYALQPWTNPDRVPGMSMGPWGQHLERGETWWEQSKAWLEYIRRCQYLLQQGLFVADICFLAPENAPQQWQTPGRTKERPGHNFDACPADALIKRMSVKNGRLVLPDGMSYRVLSLPDTQIMTPQLLAKIEGLVKAGATVIGPRPIKSPSLSGFPDSDAEVQKIAGELWRDCDGKAVKEHAFGKGKVIWGKTPQEVLASSGLPMDFEGRPTTYTNSLRFIHKALGDTDVYFVANRFSQAEDAVCAFRVTGKRPQLWHADTGLVERPAIYDDDGKTVRLPLRLDPFGSVFVIFQKAAHTDNNRIVSVSRNGAPMLETIFSPRTPQPEATNDLISTFTEAVWVKPDIEIDLPSEANTGNAAMRDNRNDVLYPPPGHDIYNNLTHSGSGLDVGLNGVCVTEHSDGYFATPLVFAAPITNWTHITIVYRDNKPSLYLNGKFVHTGLRSTFTAHCGVGVKHIRGMAPFRGAEGQFQKFDRVLTDSEIAELARTMPLPKMPAEVVPIRLSHDTDGKIHGQAWLSGVYRCKTADGKITELNVGQLPEPEDLSSSWDLQFPPNWGAPEHVALPHLISWSEYSDSGVKYFSGTATYTKTFRLPANLFANNLRLYLDLGKVAIIAQPTLNGHDLGVLWKPPFRAEITKFLKPGENTLQVKVVNLWPNRMIGDEQLPDDSDRNADGTLKAWPSWLEAGKPSPTGRYTFTTWRLWKKDSALQQSGLLGPVRIVPAKEISVSQSAQ
jgi:alpha-L-rhamnosidase/F5/8 type C domain